MKSKVLIVGDIMLDRYLITSEERVSPEGEFPLLALEKTEDRLGGAGNVARNLKALGMEPILLGIIGKDAEGQIINELCTQEFSLSALIEVKDRTTTTKTRITDSALNQYLRMDKEDSSSISAIVESTIVSSAGGLCAEQGIAAIVIQDYNKGVINEGVITALLNLTQQYDIPLITDPKRDNFKMLSTSDIFKPNLKELSMAAGVLVAVNITSISSVVEALNLGAKSKIFVTLGSQGLYYWDRQSGQQGLIPGENLTDPDVSGAGDTVLAVLTMGTLQGMKIEQLSKLANRAGALVCTKSGVSTVTLAELKAR